MKVLRPCYTPRPCGPPRLVGLGHDCCEVQRCVYATGLHIPPRTQYASGLMVLS
jgi:hypothetical protein